MHSPAEAPAEEGLWEGSASSLAFLDTIRLPAEAGVGLSGQRFTQLEIQSKVLVGGPWPFTCMEHSSEGGPLSPLEITHLFSVLVDLFFICYVHLFVFQIVYK